MVMNSLRDAWNEYECLAPKRKVGVALEIAAGLWYPLAGLLLWAFFKVRASASVFRVAPLSGAVLSLALFTVQFFVGAALSA